MYYAETGELEDAGVLVPVGCGGRAVESCLRWSRSPSFSCRLSFLHSFTIVGWPGRHAQLGTEGEYIMRFRKLGEAFR